MSIKTLDSCQKGRSTPTPLPIPDRPKVKLFNIILNARTVDDFRLRSHMLYGICSRLTSLMQLDRSVSLAARIPLKSVRDLFHQRYSHNIKLGRVSRF